MCIAVPMQLIEKRGEKGIVDIGGVRREVVLQLVKDVQEGDYVIVHAGFAIHKIDEATALETVQFLKEAAALVESGESNT